MDLKAFLEGWFVYTKNCMGSVPVAGNHRREKSYCAQGLAWRFPTGGYCENRILDWIGHWSHPAGPSYFLILNFVLTCPLAGPHNLIFQLSKCTFIQRLQFKETRARFSTDRYYAMGMEKRGSSLGRTYVDCRDKFNEICYGRGVCEVFLEH